MNIDVGALRALVVVYRERRADATRRIDAYPQTTGLTAPQAIALASLVGGRYILDAVIADLESLIERSRPGPRDDW